MALTWQEALYPLGLVSSVFFTLRVLIQWFKAERSKSSPSPISYWILSILGHGFHLIHSVIQLQLPLAIVQGCNLVISKRNFNLLNRKKYRTSLKKVIFELIVVNLFTVITFLFLCYLVGEVTWMRAPTFPLLSTAKTIQSWWIQLFGLIGITLYATRFWVQWYFAERKKKSHFNTAFWLVSLIGALLSTIYFVIILDWINILSTGFTLIPYIRNLMFLRKSKKAAPLQQEIESMS